MIMSLIPFMMTARIRLKFRSRCLIPNEGTSLVKSYMGFHVSPPAATQQICIAVWGCGVLAFGIRRPIAAYFTPGQGIDLLLPVIQ